MTDVHALSASIPPHHPSTAAAPAAAAPAHIAAADDRMAAAVAAGPTRPSSRPPAHPAATVRPADLALTPPGRQRGAWGCRLATVVGRALAGALAAVLRLSRACLGWTPARPHALQVLSPDKLAAETTRQLGEMAPSVTGWATAQNDVRLPVCPAFARDLGRCEMRVDGRRLGADLAEASAALVRLCDGDEALAHRLSALMSQETHNSLMLAMAISGQVQAAGRSVVSLGLRAAGGSHGRLALSAHRRNGRLVVTSELRGQLGQLVVRGPRGPEAKDASQPLTVSAEVTLETATRRAVCEQATVQSPARR